MSDVPNTPRTGKNTLTPEDKMKMLIAVADLPFVSPRPKVTDYMRDVNLTVLDFHMLGEVVGKALRYFNDEVRDKQGIRTHAQLVECLARFPDTREGNTEASLFLWNNRHWKRAGYLRNLLRFFEGIGVTDQPSLHEWVKTAQFEDDFKGKVPGLGLAVFQWLLIRCGVSTVKPDVWVVKFAQRITGKRLADKVLVDLFRELAPMVGESMATIDKTIWAYERMGMATKDVPVLRIVFWKQLKQRLEARLNEDDALKDGQWQVVLDDSSVLRHGQGGLRMSGMLKLPENEQPASMTVEVMQGNWRERFPVRISMQVDQLQAQALDVELVMPTTTSIDALLKQADGVAEKVIVRLSA